VSVGLLVLLAAASRVLQTGAQVVRYEAGVPEGDARAVASAMDVALADAARRFRCPAPPRVEVVVHATTAGFTKAARAPWWHAAETVAGVVHLQPPETLRARGSLRTTVRHEAAHAVIASCGRAWPRWREEGEAAIFAGEGRAIDPQALLPSLVEVEDALRAGRDRELAQRGYLSAAAFVAWLHEQRDEAQSREGYARFLALARSRGRPAQ
jgi:hypothetical protein